MKVIKYIFVIGIIMASLYACNNEDEGDGIIAIPPRDRAEQQENEGPKIKEYLETHFYTLIDNPANPDYQIPVFDTIAGINSGQTSIWDSGQLVEKPFVRDEVDYTIYMLKLNNGVSTKRAPTFADSTLVTYRGELFYDNEDEDGDGIPDEADVDADGDGMADIIDEIERLDTDADGIADDSDADRNDDGITDVANTDDDNDGILNDKDPVDNNDINRRVFDSTVTPQWFQQTGVIIGWREALTTISGASGFTENTDGTISYNMDFGNVIVFMPSGLGYFNVLPPGGAIPLYSPLIFNIQLYAIEESDHDADGIPSYLEDIDGDRRLTLDIDDNTDSDGSPNYLDIDDDNDGTLTRDEITVNDLNGDGFFDLGPNPTVSGEIIFYDDDGDGIYNHLDADDSAVKN